MTEINPVQTVLVTCPRCPSVPAHAHHERTVFGQQPAQFAFAIKRLVIRPDNHLAVKRTEVLYPVCGLLVQPGWEPYHLVSIVSFVSGHYVAYVRMSTTVDAAGVVVSKFVQHDGANKTIITHSGVNGPCPSDVVTMFYRHAQRPSPNRVKTARGLKWKDNRCYQNALLHALVYLSPSFV